MLVAEPGARQQDGREARIFEVDREARRHELGFAGLEHERRVDAGAKVEARGARGRAARQFHVAPDARIEDADLQFLHAPIIPEPAKAREVKWTFVVWTTPKRRAYGQVRLTM